jgi:DNA-directed RNA polymerase sigma subunit (sigma70/sigma32)
VIIPVSNETLKTLVENPCTANTANVLTQEDIQSMVIELYNRRGLNKLSKIERKNKIKELRAQGATFECIGETFNLSRQRIEQIINDK